MNTWKKNEVTDKDRVNDKTTRKNGFRIQDLAKTAMMAVLIAICAWVTIPSVVPCTLQTFGVFMALKLLGGSYGTLAILIYILLGAVGLPVFSGFSAGIGVLLGPTGGYIAGFLLTGVIYRLLEPKLTNRYLEDAALAFGLLVCYLFGTVRFIAVMGARGSEFTWIQGLMTCVVPYLIPDGVKLVLADILSRKIKPLLRKWG